MALTDYPIYFILVFISIFVIINPLQATIIYISLTAGMSQKNKQSIPFRTTSVAFVIAVLFAVSGDLILRFFGITVDSLRVAGGILLFLVAMDMLRGGEHRKVTENEIRDANEREDISIFPLAMPLVTGPGVITTVVVQMGAAVTLTQKALVMVALTFAFIVTYFVLRFSDYIDMALGVTGIMVVTRVQGLILGAIAVNFVATGAWNIYVSMASAT